jgi:hypothetical protein
MLLSKRISQLTKEELTKEKGKSEGRWHLEDPSLPPKEHSCLQ